MANIVNFLKNVVEISSAFRLRKLSIFVKKINSPHMLNNSRENSKEGREFCETISAEKRFDGVESKWSKEG
jgi:hypothetical protein